jgi:CMP-N-acetylneuraminic acid synthetase
LLAHAVRSARACTAISAVMVSTEDAEIAAAGLAAGAVVPFMRPQDLARDDTPMLDVLRDCLARLRAAGDGYDYVVLLQPTTPFRDPAHITAAIELLAGREDCDSIVGVTPVIDAHPRRLRRIRDGLLEQFLHEGDTEAQQRQSHADDLAYRRCGYFYISRTRTIEEQGSLYGARSLAWIVEGAGAVTIDEPLDLLLARAVWADYRDAIIDAHRRVMAGR